VIRERVCFLRWSLCPAKGRMAAATTSIDDLLSRLDDAEPLASQVRRCSLRCALLVPARASNNTVALVLRLLSMSTRSLQRTATRKQRWTRRLR